MDKNALFAKALGSDSEDEAIACLRMARKKGLKVEVAPAAPVANEYQTQQMLAMLNRFRDQRDQFESERDKYKRMLDKQIYDTAKLKKELDDVPYKMLLTIISVATISSLFWVIIGGF